MPLDVYAPCPCGSGKKLKFCCRDIVDEMEKVVRHQRNNQSRSALQILDSLEKSHPNNSWIVTSRASTLMNERRLDEAKQALEQLLAAQPEHCFALALIATIAFATDGYENSKPIIYRAFQKCAAELPGIVGDLAMGIAALSLGTEKFMAARQHLALAMQIVPDEDRREVFLRLLRLESNGDIPYPLRSVHQLAEVSGASEAANDALKAERLTDIGCWGPATVVYKSLAEREPDNAAIWKNLGLCRAWDGNELAAAEALHQAAKLESDFESAVELETLAQLLDLNSTEDVVRTVTREYRNPSVSKLLTTLDGNPQFVRMPVPERDPAEAQGPTPSGIFLVIDRVPNPNAADESLGIDDVANVIAELTIFDASPTGDQPPEAYLTTFEGDLLETSQKLFEEAAGDEIELVEKNDEDSIIETMPRDLRPLFWRWHFGLNVPTRLKRELDRKKWSHIIDECWPNSPLAALGGKTPKEAKDDSEWKLPLTAAVYVLDSFGEQHSRSTDLKAVLETLNLDPPKPIEVTDELPLNSYSAMQLHRLPVKDLSDKQLQYVLNRALLIHHSHFLYGILTETVSRPECANQVDLNRIYQTLSDLCRGQQRRDETLEWITKGREFVGTQENSFQDVLQWTVRELTFRLEDPEDPGLNPLLKHFAEYYFPKLPQLRPQLETLLESHGVEAPWQSEVAIAAEVGSGSTTDQGLWTPTGEGESKEDEKKLWLPGQD